MSRLRYFLIVLCALAVTWALVVAFSGRVVLRFGSFRVLSSREPWTAVTIALLSGLAAWALTPQTERQRHLTATLTWFRRLPRALKAFVNRRPGLASRLPSQLAPGVAALAAVTVVTIGLVEGAPYVGGSDVHGYVSQAHLWATGTLRVRQPIADEIDWPFAGEALTPLGYRPTPDGRAMVPVYSPGLPMIMGLFERLAGRDAVFYVVPLTGGLAVWVTYLMGTHLGGALAGVAAAVMLATSPSFLFQLLLPMSDVPVTAWWALSLALLLREGRSAALVSGLAAGAAILTRPNLAPLAVIPGLMLAWSALRPKMTAEAVARALLFAAGIVPAGVVIGLVNARLYGSPLATGYGDLDALYGWDNLAPNLARYPRWLMDTQTPFVLLAVVAPFVVSWRRPGQAAGWTPRTIAVMWLCFIAAVFASYLFHLPNNAWFWLRYVLPAFPLLFALMSAASVALLARLNKGTCLMAMALLTGGLAWHGIAFCVTQGVFLTREGERKSQAVGEYIADNLSQRAIFLSKLHSGSIRYYSGRLTVRYEWIPPRELDSVLADLRRLNYTPYFALEDSEEKDFRERFGRDSRLGALDWRPLAAWQYGTEVKIYDPASPEVPVADRPPTQTIR
ncbi:MAG TPA: STT3 domain-containing protein [Vicinamibacterales bacterium]|nr:STT3 domain-containing protein [Vicinamibacterales bacterium]